MHSTKASGVNDMSEGIVGRGKYKRSAVNVSFVVTFIKMC